VPWCDDCARFYNPNSLEPDGTCPTCGRALATAPRSGDEAVADERAPWHFWVLVAAVAIYLGWRVVQLIGWLVGSLIVVG
jgi:hypothetical protein